MLKRACEYASDAVSMLIKDPYSFGRILILFCFLVAP